MSSGHPFDFDDEPPPGALSDWRRIVRSYPKVLALQHKYLALPSVHSYDAPYLAGYSTRRSRIFFDKDLDYIQTIGGRRVNINPCIKLHEATESTLIDSWDLFRNLLRLATDPDYEWCHHVATAVEYQGVEAEDLKVPDYRKALRPQIKKNFLEKITKIAPDYDTLPLEQHPEDKKILDHVNALKAKAPRRLGFPR